MAFPTVQTADTKSGVVAVNTTTWTLTYPTNLAAGDLILAFVAIDGSVAAFVWPADWVQSNRLGGGSACAMAVAKKISLGTETGTFSFTTPSESGAWRVFRITGWEGTIGTLFTHTDAGSGAVAGTATAGSTVTPDPPSASPANWDIEDTLWFAAISVDASRTISVYPLPNLNTADVSGGTGGATLGVCTTNSAVATLDPGTFTISASDDWAAYTIGVRPAAVVAATKKPRALVSPGVTVLRAAAR